jgi:hypothetical protein
MNGHLKIALCLLSGKEKRLAAKRRSNGAARVCFPFISQLSSAEL